MNSNSSWVEEIRKVPFWLRSAIVFITAVISFILLIQRNIQLGIVIIGASILLSLLGMSFYVYFSKTQPLVEGGKGIYRYERKSRYLAFLGLVLTGLAIAVLFLLNSTRAFIVGAFIPKTENPSVEQMLLSKSENHYRLEIIVNNPINKDILVSRVSVAFFNPTQMGTILGCCFDCRNIVIVIHEPISISKFSEEKMLFSGAYGQREEITYEYPFSGNYYAGCGGLALFDFTLNTSVLLEAGKFTNISLLLPRKFTVTNQDTELGSDEEFDNLELLNLIRSEEICISLETKLINQVIEFCESKQAQK
jgi:hypothetical protein